MKQGLLQPQLQYKKTTAQSSLPPLQQVYLFWITL